LRGPLRLLSILHYVVGGILAVFSLFPILHLVLGLVFIFAPEKMSEGGQPPPVFIGWIFAIGAGAAILMGMTLAILVAVAGRCIARRRRLLYCDALAIAEAESLVAPDAVVIDALLSADGLLALVRKPESTILTVLTAEPAPRTAAPADALRLLPAGEDPLRVMLVLPDAQAVLDPPMGIRHST